MRADFHTHSHVSPDGSLTAAHYRQMLASRKLDVIAVTDHNTIEFAHQLHAELGDAIIVGEEITTREGEVIGLYLTEAVPALLSLKETIRLIHGQGGLVYVPHPFETVRKGISQATLDTVAAEVDIIEVHNGRAIFQDRSAKAIAWGQVHGVPGAASSDAHGTSGWGRTYTTLGAAPTATTLVALLHSATYDRGFPGIPGMLYPKLNRLKKWSKKHA